MKTNPSMTFLTCLCALASTSIGGSPNPAPAAAPILLAALSSNASAAPEDERDRQSESITDLKTQLPGTHWKAESNAGVRPGLYPTLTFNKNNVEPAGYRYQVDTHDYTVRIYFNHGDSQLMLLTDNGKRLGFTFHGKDYSYALESH